MTRRFQLNLLSLISILATFVASREVLAQVNTDPLRPGPMREGFGGGLDGSIVKLGGNIELMDIGLGGRVQTMQFWPEQPGAPKQRRGMKRMVYLMGNFHYTARASQPFLNQALLHSRFVNMWHPRIGTVIFTQHQFNEFQRLKVRSIWGASLSIPLFQVESFNLSLGSGYMFEYNHISILPGATDAPRTYEHRWSNFLGARVSAFNGRLLGQSTTYLQPRWDELADFRFLEEVEVLGKISESFGFGATFSFLYDSAPPTGVKNTDTRIVTNARISF
jgi:Protein of unknown function, DUF481